MYTLLVSALVLGLVLYPLWAIYKFFDRRCVRRRLDAAGHLNVGQEVGKPTHSDDLCVYIKPMPDDGDFISHVRVLKRKNQISTPLPKLPYEAVTEPEQPPLKPGQTRTRFVDDWGTHLKNMKHWV